MKWELENNEVIKSLVGPRMQSSSTVSPSLIVLSIKNTDLSRYHLLQEKSIVMITWVCDELD